MPHGRLAGPLLITSGVIGCALATVEKGRLATQRRQSMTDLNKIAENCIAAWNTGFLDKVPVQ